MNPERQQRIEEILRAALDLPPAARRGFTATACAGDEALRAEVETLIAGREEADAVDAARPRSGVASIDSPGALPAAAARAPDAGGLMTGRRIGAYRIIYEIGHCGVGAVYLAERADSEFRQRVAIKLVQRGTDSDLAVRRFRHERQILASLDHPNVARLFDGGTTDDGLPYFVMEYVDGQPLYLHCDHHRLTVIERLKLFRHICRAVHYAHRHQIVHCDLKPTSIIVTAGGTPKLLDFGIAERLGSDRARDFSLRTADAITTPEYASPEQLRGEAVTPASDIYSLGVLLYELLTGHRPYRLPAGAPRESARAVCEEEPAHPSVVVSRPDNLVVFDPAATPSLDFLAAARGATLDHLRRELAGNVDNIILKALRKEPAGRYQSAEELGEEILRHLEGRPISAPFYFRPARSIDGKPAAAEKTIAVLPFRFFGETKPEGGAAAAATGGDSYLGIGLADALITRLSNVRRFTVRPTGSVLRYGGDRADDPFTAGHELGANFVVDGRIRRAGERIRVTVQLLSVCDGATAWAGRFDENFTDVLALEDAISKQVAEALIPQLTGNERRQLAKRGTNDPEAFEAYLRGRYYWNMFTEEGFAKAIACYRRAIALDPAYAPVYAGIADYYNWLGVYGVVPFREGSASAKAAAQQAIALDDSLAEAHTALGFATLCHDFDWATARDQHRQALTLNPNYATAHLWYSFQLIMEGRFDEAAAEIRRAIELDPLSPINRYTLGWCYYHARRYEESIIEYRNLIRAEPFYGLAYYALSWVLRYTGEHREAISEATAAVNILGRTPNVLAVLGAAAAAANERDDAHRILREIEAVSAHRTNSPYHLALLYNSLGEQERALTLLEEAYAQRDAWLVWLGVEPQFDLLRADPRFTILLRQTNNPAGAHHYHRRQQQQQHHQQPTAR